MDSDLTLSVPEVLRQQAVELAAARGATVENVVREAIEWPVLLAIAQYVSVLAPEKLSASMDSLPQTELGARLRILRGQILAAEAPPLGWEDLQRELAERRGECDHAAFDLR